jgi:surface protein
MIYEELEKIVDSVNDMKEATGATTFTEVKDKVERMPVFDAFKSPLAQLGYTAEDEAVYKDLKIDMTTVKEDVEYSKSKMYSTPQTSLFRAFNGDTKIKYLPYIDCSKVTNMHDFVNSCSNLVAIPKLNVSSKCNTLYYAFMNCTSLECLDVSDWDVSNVSTSGGIFNNCSKLKYIDVSKWDTSKFNSLNSMFSGCSSLTSIDVRNWNVSSIANTSNLFSSCSSLKSLDVSNWDISNVTIMNNFCYLCKNLESLKINNFGVNKDVSIISLIQTCLSLGSTEEGMESLRYTFITNSFDRTAAGYPALNLSMPDVVKARFTDEEKAAITAKGFTIA